MSARFGRRPLGYQIVNRVVGDRPRACASFQCVECGQKIEIPFGHNAGMNPEALAKKAAEHGWKTNAFKTSGTYCPPCAGPRPKQQSEIIQLAVPSPAIVKDPTNDQRVMIRNLLDKHFDDSIGAYLDGMSDQAIAERAAIPRVVVERIREAAYGVLRITPEVAELQGQISALKAKIEAAQKAIDALRSDAMGLGSRLEKQIKAAA